MRRIILRCVTYILCFFTSRVEPLRGSKVTSASDGEFPFVASLQNLQGLHFCSGTLITDTHVITAAHCLDGMSPNRVWVVLGVADLRKTTLRYAVESWITYKDWANWLRLERAMDYHDIAILTLFDNIRVKVKPIRLTGLNKQQVQGKTMTIIGWHMQNTVLAKASVNLLSDHDCQRSIFLISNQIVPRTNKKILCTSAKPYVLLQDGDSGGPLLDQFGALLGVHFDGSPQASISWGNFSNDFLHAYEINLHSSIAYENFQNFIKNFTGYH